MAGVSSETLNVSRSVALDTSLSFEAILRLLTNATYLHGTFLVVPHSQHGHKLRGLDTTHPFEFYKNEFGSLLSDVCTLSPGDLASDHSQCPPHKHSLASVRGSERREAKCQMLKILSQQQSRLFRKLMPVYDHC